LNLSQKPILSKYALTDSYEILTIENSEAIRCLTEIVGQNSGFYVCFYFKVISNISPTEACLIIYFLIYLRDQKHIIKLLYIGDLYFLKENVSE
jgi:hypothetical protein